MTSSFGITPQRQTGRELVAGPEKPAAIPKPAAPRPEPSQVGGQLLDASSYQQNTKAKQSIKSIQDFLSNEGAFSALQKDVFEDYKAEKQAQAEALLAQEATAYRDALENADQTRKLAASGEPELARQNQLSNPWVNFYYYDAKATNAGRDVGIELGLWGQRNINKLAEQDPAERAASIAKEAKGLMSQYADLPQAFVAAKIDPIIAGVSQDLKGKAIAEAYNQKVTKDNETALETFFGGIKNGAKLYKGSLGDEEGIILGTASIQASYEAARNFYVTERGYSEKDFHAVLSENFSRFFIDNDGDRYNDIGDAFGAPNIVANLEKIRTSDGQSLMDLKDKKGNKFSELIMAAGAKAVKQNTTFYNEQERVLQRAKREVDRNLKTAATEFWTTNPNATEEQIEQQRASQRAFIDNLAFRGGLPDGQNVIDYYKDIEEAYPFVTRELNPTREAMLESQIDYYINQRMPMPPELAEELRGTELYATAVKKFADAANNENNPNFKDNRKKIVKNLTALLPSFLGSDQDYLDALKVGGENKASVKTALKNAIAIATPRFDTEATTIVTELLNEALRNGQDINDPSVITGITETASSRLSSLPQYNDVDNYYNVTDITKLGRPVTKAPVLAVTEGNGETEAWNIQITDFDQRATWAAVAAPYFQDNIQDAREYLQTNFVFNNEEFKELNRYINSNGDTSKISPQLRATLGNLKKAFGNHLSLSRIVAPQIRLWYGSSQIPPTFKKALNQLDQRSAEGGGGTSPVSASLIVTNWRHGHSPNNAIDFTIRRGSDQYQNPVPAPFSGTVVSTTRDPGGFGLNVVIEASESGRGYKRGDLVRLAHLAKFSVKPGQRIVRGAQVGMSGDGESPGDVGGTGAGDPGHVHIQLYKAGGVTRAFQYPQIMQDQFVRNSYAELFNEQIFPAR